MNGNIGDHNVVPIWGILGMMGVITLDHINTIVAIGVGLLTLVYLCIKIWKEIKNVEKR